MEKIHGTNMDGWLAWENGRDPEFSLLCRKDPSFLPAHLDSFIRQEDFLFIRKQGLDAVRLPLPQGSAMLEYVDRAMDWAAFCGLKILLCPLFPGSWYRSSRAERSALEDLGHLAQRYGAHPGFLGIEAGCSEGGGGASRQDLQRITAFYEEAYRTLRSLLPEDKIIVFRDVFSLTGRNFFFREAGMKNTALSVRICLSLPERSFLLRLRLLLLKRRLRSLCRDIPLLVCGWSLSSSYADRMGRSVMDLQEYAAEQKARHRQMARLLLPVLEETDGWFYDSYQSSSSASGGGEGPDLRQCVEKGYLTRDMLQKMDR